MGVEDPAIGGIRKPGHEPARSLRQVGIGTDRLTDAACKFAKPDPGGKRGWWLASTVHADMARLAAESEPAAA